MPRGCRVLHLKIRRPSALRLSLVLWRPARTTATIISSVVWPGEEKCLATGRSAFFETDLRCSQNLSPSLRPVSPTYDRVHARQVMIYTRLLVVHENLCRMVRGPPGVLIWEAGLVWAQVLHRGRRQGKVPFGSSSVFAPDWRLLLTKESRRLVSRRYAPSTRELSNSSLVSGSDFKRSKVLDRMFFTWWLMGLYVKINGMTSLLDCPSLGGRKAVSRGIVSTCWRALSTTASV